VVAKSRRLLGLLGLEAGGNARVAPVIPKLDRSADIQIEGIASLPGLVIDKKPPSRTLASPKLVP
jgi:hypothetical protein